jgi:hypothetical protein
MSPSQEGILIFPDLHDLHDLQNLHDFFIGHPSSVIGLHQHFLMPVP